MPNSCMLALPISRAPAARRRATAVASLAAAFTQQMRREKPYPLEDFMKISYRSLFAQELKRGGRKKTAPPMTYKPPETLFDSVAAAP